MKVGKTFTFDAAHHLPGYNGPCANVHGHTYHLTVEVEGEVDPKTGMVVDFGFVKDLVKSILVQGYDHADLNEKLENPTAENLALSLFKEIDYWLAVDCKLSKVILWETPTSYVEVTMEDVSD
jgi:6-pyruvoyltetrahydropterin/6-carboxytetrahydropterin synthase